MTDYDLMYECLDKDGRCLGHFHLNIATTTPDLPLCTKRIYVFHSETMVGHCGKGDMR